MPDRIDPLVHTVQPTQLDPPVHRPLIQTEIHQLGERNHAVLRTS